MIKLYKHQIDAVKNLKSGSILCGGVGTGKSLTAIEFYKQNYKDRPLFIITTARKRDSLEWHSECNKMQVKAIIDSWNNIKKYKKTIKAFFILDEQRLVGSGVWVKSFLSISRRNKWILLTATPGDTWTDYIPVFVANNFYKNKSEFLREHAIFNRFTKYPQIDRFIEVDKLLQYKKQIVVDMWYEKQTNPISKTIQADYEKDLYDVVDKKRWNPYNERPIRNIANTCFLLRKVTNSNPTRIEILHKIYKEHKKIIVFYSFDYERDIIRSYAKNKKIKLQEWNGHNHEEVPTSQRWIYLVQYMAGAEGWNCTETNTIVFYSSNYSYRQTVQAAGRVDRLNTLYKDLYYYHITSNAPIDKAIKKAHDNKKDFNENRFLKGSQK
jgi:superfamily II DNA or RNA helicase